MRRHVLELRRVIIRDGLLRQPHEVLIMQWKTLFLAKPVVRHFVWMALLLLGLPGNASADELPPITPPPSTTILGADWTPPPRSGNRSSALEPAVSELEDTPLEDMWPQDVSTELESSGTSGLVQVELEALASHTESGP